jgi:hypothetical protein
MTEPETVTVEITRQVAIDIFAATVFAIGMLQDIDVPEPPEGFADRIEKWMETFMPQLVLPSQLDA